MCITTQKFRSIIFFIPSNNNESLIIGEDLKISLIWSPLKPKAFKNYITKKTPTASEVAFRSDNLIIGLL